MVVGACICLATRIVEAIDVKGEQVQEQNSSSSTSLVTERTSYDYIGKKETPHIRTSSLGSTSSLTNEYGGESTNFFWRRLSLFQDVSYYYVKGTRLVRT